MLNALQETPFAQPQVADVTIVDCGIGNLRSVHRMIEAVDGSASIASSPDDLKDARRVILPGVGAFDAGMTALTQGGWIVPLNEIVSERRIPLLGICLGMQLLCRRSDEGSLPGLGWIQADVVPIDVGNTGLKVPHMGWSVTSPTHRAALFDETDEEQRFYYVHKYRVRCDDEADVIATATYGTTFTSAVAHGNVYGVQFHPEKSHRFGMGLMRKFLSLTCSSTV